ncbi:hypothetical protein [Halorubrum trapanicum]|uniref:hypothetical protein n=1 Tax=Halorubrum trapanicum TaxID=29284 RepID=UPI000BBAB33F|nr:hypothetical protein [Halorubrum trapanicum]
MSENPDEVMLMAGQRGGKSTFLGAMAIKIKQSKRSSAVGSSSWRDVISNAVSTDDLVGNYSVTYGDRGLFEDEVVERMRSSYRYPEQTNRRDTYIVEFNLNADQSMAKTITVAAMDIPGEAQEAAVQRLRNGNYDEDEVREKYQSTGTKPQRGAIRERINDDTKAIKNEEWEWAYLYHYLRSDRVIFLYNLYKKMFRDDIDGIIDAELLRLADADDKTGLLLFTATDMLDYDPTDYKISLLGRGSVNTRYFDDDLVKEIDRQVPGNKGDDVLELVSEARDKSMDLFGVSVPEGNRDEIEHSQGKVVLKGFENVGRWLKNTT